MEKANEKINECSKIFVSWAWLTGIIAASVLMACTIVYAYSGRESRQDNRIEKVENGIDDIQAIKNNIDTLKNMLRNK